MRKTALAIILWLASAGPAWSGPLETAFEKAQAAYNEERFDEAAQEFAQAADLLVQAGRRDDARLVYGNAAVIRMRQERWAEALALYDLALAGPGRVKAEVLANMTGNIVFCAGQLNDPARQAMAIENLFSAKPKLPPEETLNFQAILGDAYREMELYGPAGEAYKKALALKPEPERRVGLLIALGLSQRARGFYDEALADLEGAQKEAAALQLELAQVEAASNIGILHWETGRYAPAAAELEKALQYSRQFKLRRKEGVDSNNLGLVYKSAGKLNEAVALVDKALEIAVETASRHDEAIALSNRALLRRMTGYPEAAVKDYLQALALYRELGFKEGQASALMGLAKLDRLNRRYQAAKEKLDEAARIYEQLGNPGFLAEAYVQLGELHYQWARPRRLSRDLVFEEAEEAGETPAADLAPDQALADGAEYYRQALALTEKAGRGEMRWLALHGLAFAAKEKGELREAAKLYDQAVEAVLSLRGGAENPDLLKDYLHDKDDLFAQAMEVCAKLYQETGDRELLKKQMEYDEIYRNEVLRANMRMADIEYVDPAKRELFDNLSQLDARRRKLAQNAAADLKKSGPDQAAKAAAETKAAATQAALAEKEFEKYLDQWKRQYPQDAVMFDSLATVNMAEIQAVLAPNQALLQYIPLAEALIILTVTRESQEMTTVSVDYKTLAALIRDRLLAGNIVDYSAAFKKEDEENEKKYYHEGLAILEELNGYLYEPVRERLKDHDRLYILTSKYLSYVPFSALVTGRHDDGSPRYLVEDKTVSLTRLSYFGRSFSQKEAGAFGDFIIVGDPAHEVLEVTLPRLEGAMAEAKQAAAAAAGGQALLLTGPEATKSAWLEGVAKHQYEVMYFATHGVPYAETKFDYQRIKNYVEKKESEGKTLSDKDILFKNFLKFTDEALPNPSHLNGYLFMAYPDPGQNGLLTLKDILELPDKVFKNAVLAVLSACNSAVAYSPKVLKKEEELKTELEEDEAAARALVEAGWSPGVDQVCLTDTFMKRNFRNVYGTFWPAQDDAAALIMPEFLKNIKQSPPAEALRDAQLAYLRNPPLKTLGAYSTHPFFWACGNIFGQ